MNAVLIIARKESIDLGIFGVDGMVSFLPRVDSECLRT